MSSANRLHIAIGVVAALLAIAAAAVTLIGLRPPRRGETLPCGHLARMVYELGGVKKAVCVRGHVWTRIAGRWIDARDPLAPGGSGSR